MRLFEFAEDDPLRIKLATITKQLQDRAIKSGRPMDTSEFLNYLGDHGITLELSDLFDIVKKEPLSNIVKNVNKDQVIFKGQEDEDDSEFNQEPPPDDSEQVRQQMASRQLGKL